MATSITVETTVNAPIDKVWKFWNEPEHITKWAFASDEWHAPYAENDLRKDGKFKTTMAAKDGSFSFDFEGVYSNVIEQSLIAYGLAGLVAPWLTGELFVAAGAYRPSLYADLVLAGHLHRSGECSDAAQGPIRLRCRELHTDRNDLSKISCDARCEVRIDGLVGNRLEAGGRAAVSVRALDDARA